MHKTPIPPSNSNSIGRVDTISSANVNNNTDTTRTPPKSETPSRTPRSMIENELTETLPSSPSNALSSTSTRKSWQQIDNESRLSSQRHRQNSLKYGSSYGFINGVEIPEMKAGFMRKQCRLIHTLWTTRYFWLEKGVLSNYKAAADSVDEDKVEERMGKQIRLKGFKLASDLDAQTMTLLALDRSDHSIRQNITLYVECKGIFQYWEYAMKQHVAFANNPALGLSRFEELKLLSTLSLNHDAEEYTIINGSKKKGKRKGGRMDDEQKESIPSRNNRSSSHSGVMRFLSSKSTGRSSYVAEL